MKLFHYAKKSIALYTAIFAILLFSYTFFGSYIDNSPVSRGDRAFAAAKKKPGKKSRTKYFTLNFKDVDISEFLNVMSQLLRKNIILDDKVKGKITISSAKRVPVSQAYEVMKSILEVKGLAVVETENLIKVIPVREAIKKNTEVVIPEKESGEKEKKEIVQLEKTVTYLLNLKYADANEILRTLRSLKSRYAEIVVYPTLNTIIFSGSTSEINGLIKIAKELDRPSEGEIEDMPERGNIHVIHLQNAKAEELANVLSRVPFSETAKINRSPTTTSKRNNVRKSGKAARTTSRTTATTEKTTKLSIIANKETNSLIVTATPEEFYQIKNIIKKLDIVREQVLIEALIVEVSADNNWAFGIDWMLGSDVGDGLVGGSQLLGTLNGDYTDPTGQKKDMAVPASQGFQLGFLSDTSVLSFALLNAQATDSNFNVLSTPQILTIDNQEAELNVGQEIPIATNNRISDSGTQFYTYEYKSVGIKLKLTPHITKSNRITLDLYQESNDVTGAADAATGKPPELSKRDIKTRVTVIDGKTIVVGGLIQNRELTSVSKVPILGDIPLLGWLFKRKSVEYGKTNLLIFITPHIVTKQESMEAITEQKKEQQRMLQRQ